MIHDLKKYQLSKYLVKDLTHIVKILSQCQNDLMSYKKYKPILKIINNIEENKGILKHHLKKQREILKNKAVESNN